MLHRLSVLVLLSLALPPLVLAQSPNDEETDASPTEDVAEAPAVEAPIEVPAEDPAVVAARAEAEREAAAAAAVEAALEQLRTAHIGELASRTRAALQEGRPLLRPTGGLTAISRGIDDTEAQIRRLSHPSRLERIPRLSQRELADSRATWRRNADLLDDWQHTLTGRIAELEEARAALVELRQQWASLRDISEAAGSPEGRHQRILESLTEARTGAEHLDEERARIAAISDRVTDLQIVVADVSDQLRDAASAYHDRLTVQDAPPLYRGLAAEGAEEASMFAQARESFLQRAQLPEELVHEVLPSVVGLGLFFFFMVGLLAALGRSHRPDEDGGRTSAAPVGSFAREVLARPIAAAALLALIAATFVIEHAPIVLYDAIFFATLLPLWRAVPPLCTPSVRTLVKGSIVVLAVDRAQSFLPEGTGALRIVLLLEALVALGALAYWLRSVRGQNVSRRVTALVAVAALVLVAAVFANIAGYVFFATVLTRGTGFAAYNALTYAGAVIVLESVVDLLVVSPLGQRLRSFQGHPALVHKQTLRFLATVASLAWVVAALEGYGVWGALSSWLEDVLGEVHEVGTLAMSWGALLGAVLVLVLTSMVLRLVRFILELDILPRLNLEPGVDGAISGLTRYLIGGTGLLLALASLGIDTAQIALVAGALGVGIGFGLQGIVANFIAGIVLMIERPVRLGDFIEAGSLVGIVDRIGLRSSTIRGMDGAEVIVPNESLISREVTNWTLSDRMRRVAVKVGVAYGSDPHDVLAVLRKVLEAHQGIIQLDRAKVVFDGFGDSSLDFTVLFWAASTDDAIRLKSEVGVAMFDALKEAHIEIPFPQREVRVVGMPKPDPAPADPTSTPAAPAPPSPKP